MLCCILFVTATVFAQTATTSLRGVIKDPTGALVPGASVTLANKATDNIYRTVTNAAGYYIFPVVSPAHYQIAITASGFATQTVTAELLVSQPATLNFVLSVKAATITVDVSATTEALNLTDATIGNAVENSTIETLPMEGRDPVNLLSLQPGVLYIGTEISDSRQGAVAGGRSDEGNITLDGLDDNDQIGGKAFTGVLRSTLDSTEEFRVTTSNGTAEAGRSSGAQVNLITKAGTNQQHGSLYEYYRPTNTVANDYFHKRQEIVSGEANIPQKYVMNTFGGSTGGAIKKDKLFYFFNYEGQRKAISDVVGATVPTQSFMNGELQYTNASGNPEVLSAAEVKSLDAACVKNTFKGSPVCPDGPGANAAVLSYYANVPTATGTGANAILGDGYNSGSYYFTSPAPSTLNTSILKIDYTPNNAHHFFVRGNLQKDTQSGDENLPGQAPSSFSDDNTKGISFGYTWVPTARIVNDLRYGFVRQGSQTSGIGKGDYVSFRYLTQPTSHSRNSFLHVPVNNITDTFSWSKGTHTFAFGGNWRGITNQNGTDAGSFNSASINPAYANKFDMPVPDGMESSFSSSWQQAYADLMGIIPEVVDVYNYKITGATTGAALAEGAFVDKNFHSNEFEYYLQDTWHARRNLTLTFGLRHTLLQTPYETHGQQISPTVDTDAWYKMRESKAEEGEVYEPLLTLAPSGKANHKPGYWPKQKANFAPRLGIVYAPDAKTSIRASAGIYFDHYGEALVNSFDQNGSYGLDAEMANSADQLSYETAPRFTGAHNLPDITMPALSSTQSFPYTPPANGFGIDWGIDNHLKTPYAESFNLSVQRELPGGFVLEQAYVGRLGRHLFQQVDLAEPVNYKDPQGGGSYFAAAKQLSAEVDAAPFGTETQGYFAGNKKKVNHHVAAIPYFEHVFSNMENYDYAGENATQAIFNNEWSGLRYTDGETLAIADLDNPYWGEYPDMPSQSRFWSSQFSSLYALDSIGTSSYNALQFTLRHPAAHGFSIDVNYTFSKSLDLGSEAERASVIGNTDNAYTNFAIQNTWNPKLNKGVSDFDAHSLVTSDWSYILPVGRGKAFLGSASRVTDALAGGWQWAGLVRWTSGLPFTLESPAFPTNYDNPGFGVKVAPIALNKHMTNGATRIFSQATTDAINSGIYFGNPIRLPYAGEAGQRNNYRGDGYFDIDSSLAKSWKLGDWAKLKFAAEVYNLTNSVRFDVSWADLNSQTDSTELGTYSGTLSTYRRMQFGLRLDF
jgi:hypothetical protein